MKVFMKYRSYQFSKKERRVNPEQLLWKPKNFHERGAPSHSGAMEGSRFFKVERKNRDKTINVDLVPIYHSCFLHHWKIYLLLIYKKNHQWVSSFMFYGSMPVSRGSKYFLRKLIIYKSINIFFLWVFFLTKNAKS